MLERFLRLLASCNIPFYGYRRLWSAGDIYDRRNTCIHPDKRTVGTNEPPFELEWQPLFHQAVEGCLIFRDIVRGHEVPARLANQIGFRVTQHVAKCFIDIYKSALCILTHNSGRCLPENRAEAFFRFSKSLLRLFALGDIVKAIDRLDNFAILILDRQRMRMAKLSRRSIAFTISPSANRRRRRFENLKNASGRFSGRQRPELCVRMQRADLYMSMKHFATCWVTRKPI